MSEVVGLLSLLNITLTFYEIENMSKKQYKVIIKKSIRIHEFQQLILRQQNMSKGHEIKYGDILSTQPYLLPNNVLSVEDKEDLFSYRCRMNFRKYNFPGNKEN